MVDPPFSPLETKSLFMHHIRAALLIALSSAAIACSKAEVPLAANGPTTTVAAALTASVAVSGHIVKVADGLDIQLVKNQEMFHPQFSLTPPDVDTPVIFAIVQNEEATISSPLLLKKIGGTWKIIKLDEADYREWVYAAAVPSRKELWGILDVSGESRDDKLTLLRSTDDGATWQFFAGIKKPTSDAEYAGFAMDKTGAGRLSVHLEDDTDGIAHGYYHYKTVDGGKTWTGPTFEGDDILQADPLSDVDTLQEAMKDADSATTAPSP